MEYYEVKVCIKMKEDRQNDKMYEVISGYINYSILNDSRLSRIHKVNCFKFYTFSLPAPIEEDRIYKKGRLYSFNIRSISSELVMRMARSLAKGCESFTVEGTSCNRYRFNAIDKLISLTPVVITLQNGRYLTMEDSDKIVKCLTNNAARKYKAYYGEPNEVEFISDFTVKNKRLIQMPYKNTCIMGNKIDITVKPDENSQRLAHLIASVGIGEKNSLGAGYCKVIYRKEG